MPRVAASSSILMHLKTVNWRHGSAESCMVFGDTNLSPGPISICGAHMPQSGASWRGSECTHHWPRGYAASTVRQRYLCRERHPERPTGQGHSSNLGTAEAGCEVKTDSLHRRSRFYRYAIDASKIERELSWQPLETFESGIRKTIEWYLANQEWTRGVVTESYRRWMALQYSL